MTRNGGIGFITMKKGVGESFDVRDRWFAYYTFRDFAQILEGRGLKMLPQSYEKEDADFEHTWLIFFVEVVK